jgi:hypothetical protein
MTELKDWDRIKVPQRHETGCVPTSYEWLIRYLKIQGVKLDTFQEDFDFGVKNCFPYVSTKIHEKYSFIKIQVEAFTKGADKVAKIKTLIDNQIPCVMSLALGIGQGWHMMPIILIDDKTIAMIHHSFAGQNDVWDFTLDEIIKRHDHLPGGNDITWIQL